MGKYEVAVVVVALITTAITIGAPVIKLNTAITQLIVKLDKLGEDFVSLETRNHDSHRRLWEHNEEQDEKISDHESRLKIIEKGRKE